MPQKILIEELTSTGFQVVKVRDDWPGNDYCVVFRKASPWSSPKGVGSLYLTGAIGAKFGGSGLVALESFRLRKHV